MPAAILIFSLQDTIEIDTTGSNGEMSLVQIGGTTASITGPVSEVFRIERPDGHPDILTFELTATADGPVIVQEIKVFPLRLAQQLVCQGGDSSELSSWV